jgi:L,D-transpeptidase-like protein
MRVLTNLLFKVTVSSMILTAPAMIDGHPTDGSSSPEKETESAFASSTVIRHYIDHLKIWPVHSYMNRESRVASFPYIPGKVTKTAVLPVVPVPVETGVVEKKVVLGPLTTMKVTNVAKALEIRRVIHQSDYIYRAMGLEKAGLSETAFEYAWRGYRNLVKRGSVRKRSVLSIADFSQSSSEKRMYVIDIRHRRLLYRTYVAHGQNSGAEYAETFSNEPESFKSSLGFYVTRTTYVGKNGLSLRLDGVDDGYNDQAMKRNIVLHGCSYVGENYLENFGATGTSLGCPALPETISGQIIHAVKGGTCLFIYHPTQDYLDHSVVINQ